MNHFILMDAGIGNFVVFIVGPIFVGFLIGALYLTVKSILVIRRELKNEKASEKENNEQS
ncbi:MAG: hypothetical protein J6I66_02825 [Lachnospiraceae bacterium]|nr:hypothetical protein [Lachnospiraceae bacterium]MBP3753772.1 hypothetical protein [Lachnospiraceae bacterium]